MDNKAYIKQLKIDIHDIQKELTILCGTERDIKCKPIERRIKTLISLQAKLLEVLDGNER